MINISILEFPFNLGLKESLAGKEPGVKRLPEWLKLYGFYERVKPVEVKRLTPPKYQVEMDVESAVLNADAIVRYATEQAVLLNEALENNFFPLVIGGDCSIMIGNALALKQKGNYAVLYLDGHTDFMGPDISRTGAAGGMAAAIIAGRGHQKLSNINGMAPYINEEHLWCVGNREYNEEYENVVRHSGATYLSLDSLREKGIINCLNSFLDMVNEQNLAGFWLHIDVDVLDDDLMPAVDSRTPGGLSYDEFDAIIKTLISSPKAAGLEITILDPDLDPSGKYTKEFIYHFTHSCRQAGIHR